MRKPCKENSDTIVEKSAAEHGFATIDIIIVIIIIGILAVVAMVRFNSVENDSATAVANLMISDIAYAQEIAKQEYKGTAVGFYSGQGSGRGRGRGGGVGGGWGGGEGGGQDHGEGGGEEVGDITLGIVGTYAVYFQDETNIVNPTTGGDYLVDVTEDVTITSSDVTLEFDSSGKMTTSGIHWGAGESSKVIVTLNGTLNIRIARHTGKVWIE
ncbi:MAG: hypothetical protein HQ568_05725 [Calditrichaeota bacterium]|nr:hypothetical protein [Calditrichota bacterium]